MSKFHNREEKKNWCISSQRKELKSGFEILTEENFNRRFFRRFFLNRIQVKIVSILDVHLVGQYYNVDVDLRAFTSCFS